MAQENHLTGQDVILISKLPLLHLAANGNHQVIVEIFYSLKSRSRAVDKERAKHAKISFLNFDTGHLLGTDWSWSETPGLFTDPYVNPPVEDEPLTRPSIRLSNPNDPNLVARTFYLSTTNANAGRFRLGFKLECDEETCGCEGTIALWLRGDVTTAGPEIWVHPARRVSIDDYKFYPTAGAQGTLEGGYINWYQTDYNLRMNVAGGFWLKAVRINSQTQNGQPYPFPYPFPTYHDNKTNKDVPYGTGTPWSQYSVSDQDHEILIWHYIWPLAQGAQTDTQNQLQPLGLSNFLYNDGQTHSFCITEIKTYNFYGSDNDNWNYDLQMTLFDNNGGMLDVTVQLTRDSSGTLKLMQGFGSSWSG